MSAFTKAPWNKDKRKESLVGPDGKRVVVYGSGLSFAGLPDTESVANSHLIAAAPEMYEALVMVRDADEDCKRDGLPTIPPAARSTIDNAIAKAEGK